MAFVSYAQNFEDVMLWRALQHVERGFYIDVGAAWPEQDSVTKAFYDRGWSGINLEPNPMLHALLKVERQRDTNLQLALSDKAGTLTLNIFDGPGLSTLDGQIAEQHVDAGLQARKLEVDVSSLAAVWASHVPVGADVHFLKVDVEGAEFSVLRGNDWKHCRPWVVVVEATRPMSQVESHAEWEPVLLDANYVFAYADGLNRFYVAREHVDLLPALRYPPNVFDEFRGATEAKSIAAIRAAYENSWSWRVTAPLRWISAKRKVLFEKV